MTVPDSEAATRFGDAAAAAETFFETGGRTSGSANDSPTAGPLAVGQAFGTRYHIIRLLGVGGMGAVYQAWDAELGVAVAIKVIRPEIMADADAAAEIERRFKRELLLARQVTHKNVVRIHDLGEIDGIKYITMPYVEGTDLATVLSERGQAAGPDGAAHRAPGRVRASSAAHAAGVVHRDLKPANIMIDADGEALIMDFGIARSTAMPAAPVPAATVVRRCRDLRAIDATLQGHDARRRSSARSSTWRPSRRAATAVDQRADIYAFGLILYDMLVGAAPRRAGGERDRGTESADGTGAAAGQVRGAGNPGALDALVSRCLEPADGIRRRGSKTSSRISRPNWTDSTRTGS